MRKKEHTRVPNILSDIVYPLLSGSEQKCLHYIVRRTYGFTDGDGGRKIRDTVSLKQFEDGIITSNDVILDFGTGLSRSTVQKQLKSLQKKGLVESLGSCTRCFWEESPESQPAQGDRCPRCHSTVSSSWSVAELTPKLLLRFINEDPDSQKILGEKKVEWSSDDQRFRVIEGGKSIDKAERDRQYQEEFDRLMVQVWHPELVKKMLSLAASKNKNGKIQISSQVRSYLRKVVEMQEEFKDSALVKYAIEETMKGPVFRGSKPPNKWYNYAKAVARNNKGRKQQPSASPESQPVDEINAMLREAAKLNGTGKPEEARKILKRMLALVPGAAQKCGGEEKARDLILLSFRHGTSDMLSAEHDQFAPDYLEGVELSSLP